MNRASLLFIANNNIGAGLSGGDRIFSRLIRHWRDRMEITLLGSEEAEAVAGNAAAGGYRRILTDFRNASPRRESLFGLARHVIRRTRRGLRAVDEHPELAKVDWVYSVSDAYPDFLPALRLKRRNPGIRWIAGYYLFAPPPWQKDSPYRGPHALRGLIYWLIQIPSYYWVRKHADVVFVTSEPDVRRFVTPWRDRSRVIVVRGGVDTEASETCLRSGSDVPVEQRKYHACFLGRFHYQKGVLELIRIWGDVVRRVPEARLAMIGNGPLEGDVRHLVKELGLADHVDLLGYMDGEPKHRIFQQSRLMVHPATYDSGGMAAAEGMAWRLPGVSFDLEALRTYYPKGMLKAAPGDLGQFAEHIVNLLTDRALYDRMADDALSLIREQWDWKRRADEIYSAVFCGNAEWRVPSAE